MAKKHWTERAEHLDNIVRWVAEAKAGKPKELLGNLEAMAAFMRMWSKDYGDEDEPRLSLITATVADLIAMLVVHVMIDRDASKAKRAAQRKRRRGGR